MKLASILTAALVMVFAATSVNAQAVTHRSDKAKIKHGVKNGELTKAETVQLAKQQRHIRRDVRAAKADGKITRAERKHIKTEKRKADRNIYRKKHNRRDRN